MVRPAVYEAFAGEFAHCGGVEFGEDGEDGGFVEFDAEVG